MVKSFHATIRHVAGLMFFNKNGRNRKRAVEKFSDKSGLLYLGSVNQHSDEHRLVRGFTASLSHHDRHYCVGSADEYDILVVDRTDALWRADGSVSNYNWLIMAFDLHTKSDIPHFFMGPNGHDPQPYTSFFTIFRAMKQIKLGTFEDYSPEFTSRFTFYSQPSSSIQIERLFPNDVTRVIGAHFWPLAAEQHEGTLYIYSDEQRISPNLLDTMLENGLWLAKHLDRQAELI